MKQCDERSLTHLLDGMEHAARHDTVSVKDVLDEFGERSVLPFILVASLLLVSPLSGLFGVTTLIAMVIIVLSAQALWGRRRLWLPGFILRRRVKSSRLLLGNRWLRAPSKFFDRHSGRRLLILVTGPMRSITLLTCMVLPTAWPMLEFVPFASSFGGGTVALFSFGLFTRDGLYVLLGYLTILVTSVVFYAILF
ncbi:MAG: exopolysaccharide biosynthesis protein [Sulfitobacter sp.]|uniref:exopolysaccharide biosynthesis protein n=1 Tax=Sulfitobacter sp. TaxID=1903071 RepID=UPI00405819B2